MVVDSQHGVAGSRVDEPVGPQPLGIAPAAAVSRAVSTMGNHGDIAAVNGGGKF